MASHRRPGFVAAAARRRVPGPVRAADLPGVGGPRSPCGRGPEPARPSPGPRGEVERPGGRRPVRPLLAAEDAARFPDPRPRNRRPAPAVLREGRAAVRGGLGAARGRDADRDADGSDRLEQLGGRAGADAVSPVDLGGLRAGRGHPRRARRHPRRRELPERLRLPGRRPRGAVPLQSGGGVRHGRHPVRERDVARPGPVLRLLQLAGVRAHQARGRAAHRSGAVGARPRDATLAPMERRRTGVGRTASRVALAASVASFLFVALVAATPESPFTPILPSEPGGPFRWLAELVGLDGVHGSALAAVGVVAVSSAAVAFVLVLRESRRGTISARTVIGLAVAYHIALLFLPLLFSRDVYSYAYYGRIAAAYHANPYVATPADFPHDVLATFVGPKWVDTPAVYGALWTQVSAVVTRAADDVETVISVFRVIAMAASLGTVFVVAGLVRRVRPEREAFAVAVVGLNPVVLFQSAASGHNDLLVELAVAVALALVFSGRKLWATAALALGALVKVTAAVPLLLWWVAVAARRPRGERVRTLAPHLGLAAAFALVAAAPFANTEDPTLGAVELGSHEGWLAPSRFFRRVVDAASGDVLGIVPRIAFALIAVAAVVAVAGAVWRRRPDIGSALVGASWGWGLLCLMLLGPVLLPWYVTWALPLGWLLPRVPRTVLIGTGLALTVSQWTSEPAAFGSAYDANLLVGHYVITPVVIALLGWLLLDLWRRTRSGAPLEDEPDQVPAAAGER